MAKKLISVWLSATILFFSTIAIYADEKVEGQFLNRNININGTTIENYYLEKPLITYGGFTYLPLNEEMGDLLGFDFEMDWDSNTLRIFEGRPTRTDLKEKVLKNNLKDVSAIVVREIDVSTITYKERAGSTNNFLGALVTYPFAKDIDGNSVIFGDGFFKSQHEDQVLVDTETYPVLIVGDTLYVPVRVFTDQSKFQWDVHYDNFSGVYISSDKRVKAISLLDQKEADYNKGLANYIMDRNRSISLGWALTLVFIFKHEAEISGIDETLLMAMAQRESTFRHDAVGRSGPVGIMQIMPGTAAGHGITPEDLLDPHVNIEFGARYIKAKFDQFGNNQTVALSAYNYGNLAISRGRYNTRYADNVRNTQNGIERYLVNRGYK